MRNYIVFKLSSSIVLYYLGSPNIYYVTITLDATDLSEKVHSFAKTVMYIGKATLPYRLENTSVHLLLPD